MKAYADDDPLNQVRQRIELCRRMAKTTHNLELARILSAMAKDGERDLEQLLRARERRVE